MKPRILGKRKWLVIFVKDLQDDITALETLIKRVENALMKTALPHRIITTGEDKRTEIKRIGSKVGIEGELPEEISRVIINNLISLKKELRVQRVAIVFSERDFYNNDIFTLTVKDHSFKSDEYYAICWKCSLDSKASRSGILSMTKKLNCLETQCGICANLPGICDHSCFPRLLWLLFNEDYRIKGVLKEIAANDLSYV